MKRSTTYTHPQATHQLALFDRTKVEKNVPSKRALFTFTHNKINNQSIFCLLRTARYSVKQTH